MKKTVLFLALALSSTAMAEVNLRVGVDPYSKGSGLGKYTSGKTENIGFEVGAEYLFGFPMVKIGAGIAYQSHAKFSGNDTDWNIGGFKENYKGYSDFKSFDSVPLYVTAKVTPLPFLPFNPYFKVNLGYSFNFGNKNIVYSQGTKFDDDYMPPTGMPELPSESRIINTNISDGLYYGIGVGAEIWRVGLEIMYQANILDYTVKDDGASKKHNINYDRVSLLLNFRF